MAKAETEGCNRNIMKWGDGGVTVSEGVLQGRRSLWVESGWWEFKSRKAAKVEMRLGGSTCVCFCSDVTHLTSPGKQ